MSGQIPLAESSTLAGVGQRWAHFLLIVSHLFDPYEQGVPLQNRITPFGEFLAVPDKGDFMGNRGILHNDAKLIVRNRESRRDWMICALAFKDWKQTIMKPGSYTQLFFLDEATALAAGHRPCFTCRRDAFNAFKAAWLQAGLYTAQGKLSVTAIDPVMHRDRMGQAGQKITYRELAKLLPDGAMIAVDGEPQASWLLQNKHMLRWSPGGYSSPRPTPDEIVTVLTPACTVKVFEAGYSPALHASATGRL